MSWFYDVLKQAEQEHAPASSPQANLEATKGADFLAALESVSRVVPHDGKTANVKTTNANVDSVPLQIHTSQSSRRQPAHSFALVQDKMIASEASCLRMDLLLPDDSRLVFHVDRHRLAAEQYRLLCRNLAQRLPDGGVVIITSPGEGDGKTLTAVNLSACMAETSDPTLLVDLDARRPGVSRMLSIDTVAQTMRSTHIEGDVHPHHSIYLLEKLCLHVAMMTGGSRDPVHLLRGDTIERLLDWARKHFRWVIIDTAPVVPVADVGILAPYADAVLMVVRAHKTPRDLLKRALEMVGPRLSGVILNEATSYSNPYYRYLNRSY